ncbi:MAG TPA: ion channel [Vicinamibacterales bacterium]|nr:ion channel [Vicinamibacterales bacterium]
MAQNPRESHRTEDPGIGTTFGQPLDRLLQRDGAFSVDRIGEARGLREGFIALATMPAPRLVLVIIATYLTLNLTFGSIYMLVGVQHLGNADLHSLGSRWLSAIGMSVQTLTTVGYGSLYPTDAVTWLIAAVEGVFGILGFSLTSAIIYTRFARPTTRLVYSDQALIAPFKDGWSLQLRVANRRRTLLVEIEARVILVLSDPQRPDRLEYFALPLQFSTISFLPLTWTLVHPITPDSAFAGMTMADLTARRAEVIVILKGIDEGYMQPVITRHSFRFDEIVWGGRFTRAFTGDGGRMRLDLDGLSRFTPVEAPERLSTSS